MKLASERLFLGIEIDIYMRIRDCKLYSVLRFPILSLMFFFIFPFYSGVARFVVISRPFVSWVLTKSRKTVSKNVFLRLLVTCS